MSRPNMETESNPQQLVDPRKALDIQQILDMQKMLDLIFDGKMGFPDKTVSSDNKDGQSWTPLAVSESNIPPLPIEALDIPSVDAGPPTFLMDAEHYVVSGTQSQMIGTPILVLSSKSNLGSAAPTKSTKGLSVAAAPVEALVEAKSVRTPHETESSDDKNGTLDPLFRLKHENEQLKSEVERLHDVVKSVETERFRLYRVAQIVNENSKCPICQDICILPVVLGTCGHHMCEKCLSAYDKASQRRVCPTCRADIIGCGFPVVAFNSLITCLIETKFVEANLALLSNHFRTGARMPYPKRTAPFMHAEALRIAQWAQTRLGTFGGVHAVATAKEIGSRLGIDDPFVVGVLFDFEPSTSLQFVDVVARLMISRYSYFVARVTGRATLLIMSKSSVPTVSATASALGRMGAVILDQYLSIRIRSDGHVHLVGTMATSASSLPAPPATAPVTAPLVNPLVISAADVLNPPPPPPPQTK